MVLSFSPQKAHLRLEGFLQAYSEKKAPLDDLVKICNRKFQKNADLELWAYLGFVYVQLSQKDKNAIANNKKWFEKVQKSCAKHLSLNSLDAFSPLFAQAKRIHMIETRIESISCLTSHFKMDPLYPSLFISLNHSDEARILFNSLIEERFLLPLSSSPSLEIHSFPKEVNASLLAENPQSITVERIQSSCSTTHPLWQKTHEREDPCADTCSFSSIKLEKKELTLVALSDGSGQGSEVVEIARLVTKLFIEKMQLHLPQHLDKLDKALLSSAFHAAINLRQMAKSNHSATFAAAVCSSEPQGVNHGAVLRVGDTCLFILYEAKNEVFVEEIDPLPSEKLTSANGGAFSRWGDYSSLSIATFQIPEHAERAYLILGSDGLSDNLDPRNALKEQISQKIKEVLADEKNHYKIHTLTLENGKEVDLNNAMSSGRDRKNPELLSATHLFPTPEHLVQYLKMCSFKGRLSIKLDRFAKDIPPSWSKGHSNAINELIQLYKIHKIREIYLKNREQISESLLQEAIRNGKPDDCIIASIQIK